MSEKQNPLIICKLAAWSRSGLQKEELHVVLKNKLAANI